MTTIYPFKQWNNFIYLETSFYDQNPWFVDLLKNEYKLHEIVKSDNGPIADYTVLSPIDTRIFKLYFNSFNCSNFPEILFESDIIIRFDIETANDIYNHRWNSVKIFDLRTNINTLVNTLNTLKFIKTLIVSPKTSGIYSYPFEKDILKYLYSDNRCRNTLCLDLDDEGKMYNTNGIFIRDWLECISLDRELRVFVINHKVVGISQQMEKYSYFMNYYVKYNKDFILDQVREKIVDKVKFPRYCADIAITDLGIVIPIEINPFYDWCNTGMCLFRGDVVLDPIDPPFLIREVK